jgi:hypothetical protein
MLALACGAVEKTAAEEVESVYRTNRRGGISHRAENPYEISHEVKKEEPAEACSGVAWKQNA